MGARMRIGIGLDGTLGLSFAEHRALAREAAALGYDDVWTPAGATARDSFHVCAAWHQATDSEAQPGLRTGIAVVPVAPWTAPTLAAQAGTVSEMTGGRFILGIGTGAIQSAEFQNQFDRPAWPPVAMMRDYLIVLRGLLSGQTVTHEGKTVTVRGLRLAFSPPATPVYLAALGPQMLRLAGELSDGVLPNWTSADQVPYIREQIDIGASRADRDPKDVQLVQFIRMCIDDDVDVARRAFARNVLPYATARPGQDKRSGYRGHFARMGFDAVLSDLEARRDAGSSVEELVDRFPPDLSLKVGYFGKPAGAAAAFRALAVGHDTAIARVINADNGLVSARAVLQACQPRLTRG
jgi:alkanesulfonate monooxygenase SsuD/methylene tetrahydromethanopterin reductase-like flavin-dependent oxidoreductase (luciferase family)